MNKHQMTDSDMLAIKNLTLAPYIQLAVRLIDVPRRHLSNAFRHQGDTLFILFDYGYTDPVLLKAAIIHDLLEDCPETRHEEITRHEDGPAVLALVQEVSRQPGETKDIFLRRILETGSTQAKILKSADRISNLIALGFTSDAAFIQRYIKETADFVLPMANQVSPNMARELCDLLASRQSILEILFRYNQCRIDQNEAANQAK